MIKTVVFQLLFLPGLGLYGELDLDKAFLKIS